LFLLIVVDFKYNTFVEEESPQTYLSIIYFLLSTAAIGISAMMHGYMAFGKDENILVPFRTWRNTNTAKAAAELSELGELIAAARMR
jgi:hypothetical protein